MPTSQWSLPVNIAIGLHLFFVLSVLYLPGLFQAKPKFADIYTVSLINIAEPVAAPPQQTETVDTSPPAAVKPVNTKKVAPIIDTPPTSSPAPAKAISLKPFKRKKKKKIVKVDDSANQKEIDRKNRRKLADILKEEELLSEKAKLAQDALEKERQLLQPRKQTTVKPKSTGKKTGTAAPSGSSSNTNLITSQYHAAIFSRLHQFWSIPEYLEKNSTLTAVVGITISQNGGVANMIFESQSGDRVFDQFVRKTLESANPLPPIPPAMKKQRYEIGLIFKPGGIQ